MRGVWSLYSILKIFHLCRCAVPRGKQYYWWHHGVWYAQVARTWSEFCFRRRTPDLNWPLERVNTVCSHQETFIGIPYCSWDFRALNVSELIAPSVWKSVGTSVPRTLIHRFFFRLSCCLPGYNPCIACDLPMSGMMMWRPKGLWVSQTAPSPLEMCSPAGTGLFSWSD